jgi:hypothetical protein
MSANPENINNELAQKTYELEAIKAQNTHHLETAKLLLDEWKWRHQHCWKSLNRGVLSAVTVSLAPYVWLLRDGDNAIKSGLRFWVLIFPVVAAFVVQAAVSLFAGEYIRCRPVLAKYNELLGDDSPNPPDKKATANWKMSVAQWTILGYGAGAALLSLGNAYLLTRIASLDISTSYNKGAFWIASLSLTILLITFDIWLMDKTRKGVQSRISPGQDNASMRSPGTGRPKTVEVLPSATIQAAPQDSARNRRTTLTPSDKP